MIVVLWPRSKSRGLRPLSAHVEPKDHRLAQVSVMRSRAAKFTLGAVAWIALSAAGYVVFQSEKIIAERRAALRNFDLRAREAVDVIGDARAGQQAYVAAGQGVAFWMPKVAFLVDSLGTDVDTL